MLKEVYICVCVRTAEACEHSHLSCAIYPQAVGVANGCNAWFRPGLLLNSFFSSVVVVAVRKKSDGRRVCLLGLVLATGKYGIWEKE